MSKGRNLVRYFVRHVTRFTYSAPVYESVMELRMQPRSDEQQRCQSFNLRIRPGVPLFSYADHFGNVVSHFDIPALHERCEIVALSSVEVAKVPDPPEALPGSSWAALEGLRADPELWEWLQPSRFARPSRQLDRLCRELGLQRLEADPLTYVRRLNTAIFHAFAYKREATHVDSPIEDAIAARSGVCQDFAHVAIALMRRQGIPARYVSGYLYHGGSRDRANPNASHAWAEAYLPELGWIGIDPTNEVFAQERHIRVALGRDYADVPPNRGVFKGAAQSELAVSVTVSLNQHEVTDTDPILAVEPVPPRARPTVSGLEYMQQQQQ